MIALKILALKKISPTVYKDPPLCHTPALFYTLLDYPPMRWRQIKCTSSLTKEEVRFMESITNSSVCFINLLDLSAGFTTPENMEIGVKLLWN